MRSFIVYSLLIIGGTFISQSAAANSPATAKLDTLTMHVDGVCTMCKERIETAAYDVKGVKSVNWDLDSGQLTVIAKSGKTSRQAVADALAQVGHSSELAEALPAAYAELPHCCKYDDGVPKHHDKK